jgi:hypothetical protein
LGGDIFFVIVNNDDDALKNSFFIETLSGALSSYFHPQISLSGFQLVP